MAPAGGDWPVGPAEPQPQVSPAHQARLRQGNFLIKDENRGPSSSPVENWRTGMKRDNSLSKKQELSFTGNKYTGVNPTCSLGRNDCPGNLEGHQDA